MKGLAKTSMWEFLELIREKARENIKVIKKNNEEIVRIERQVIMKEEDSVQIAKLKEYNCDLTKENHELLDLHRSIITLGEEHRLYVQKEFVEGDEPSASDTTDMNLEEEHEAEMEKSEVLEPSHYMEMAEEGKLDFSSDEPWLEDKTVFDGVYQTLLTAERYEDCQRLIEARQQKEKAEHKTSVLDKLKFWK